MKSAPCKKLFALEHDGKDARHYEIFQVTNLIYKRPGYMDSVSTVRPCHDDCIGPVCASIRDLSF